MLKRYHHIVGGVFRIVDASVIGLAWLASYFLRFYLPGPAVTKGFPPLERYASLTPLVMILWALVFSGMKVYQSRRMLRRTHEVQVLLRSHGVAMLFFLALTYLFSEYRYSRVVMLYFGLLSGVFLVVFRLSLRNGLRAFRARGFNLRYVLLVGQGPAVETLRHRIAKFPELGLRIADTIAPNAQGQYPSVRDRLYQNRAIRIDQVQIALPRAHAGALDEILLALRDEPVDIQLIPDIHEFVTLGCEIEDFDGLPILNLNDSPLYGWGGIVKRATDAVVAAVALVILSPTFALVALGIKLTSRGPIFYVQERMGLDGRTFRMFKFRSMRIDAEASSGAVWATEGDARRTAFGTFLRKSSLDELPQLWNVFLGQMSLVGPRPERPIFVQKFRSEIPHYMLRHKVKAGMTGWAQINGWRGNTSLEKRIECDLYYIRNWSYAFDWKIMVMTIWRVRRNAY